jgi:hypothetical protein
MGAMHPGSAGVVFLLATLASGCSTPERTRAAAGIQPTYDTATGRLKQLTLDSNHNGRVDTWTDMDGARPLQTRIDSNEDGKVDRWEYYDALGKLTKVGFSRKDDGKPDAWAFSGGDGRIERIEISSVAAEKKIDRWEHYDASGLIAVEEDTNSDGAIDKWETYQGGALTSAAFDENFDGVAERRLTYQASTLVMIETAPDGRGGFATRVQVR